MLSEPGAGMTGPTGPWLASADALAVIGEPDVDGDGVASPPQATSTSGSSQPSSSRVR